MPAKIRISRRGFRNAPMVVADRANRIVREMIDGAAEVVAVRAELRPAVYCGPGSAGDRGAYSLALTLVYPDEETSFSLTCVAGVRAAA